MNQSIYWLQLTSVNSYFNGLLLHLIEFCIILNSIWLDIVLAALNKNSNNVDYTTHCIDCQIESPDSELQYL